MNLRKRTFHELRYLILTLLLQGQQTTNQISVKTGINWRTVESHLTFLIGKGFVSEVFKSEYVRIFKLTQDGERQALLNEATITADETDEAKPLTEDSNMVNI